MEVSAFLLKGIILGFSIAAPVGPIGVLCIRRTLYNGIRSGIYSGLGVALADSLYGLIAAFGLTAVSSLFMEYMFILRLCGGLALLYIGGSAFFSRPADTPAKVQKSGSAGDFSSAFLLTLTNPLTILSFSAIFASMGVGDTQGDYEMAAVMVLGVFSGSLLWWVFLSTLSGCFRNRLTLHWMVSINRISGVLICIFGLISMATLLS